MVDRNVLDVRTKNERFAVAGTMILGFGIVLILARIFESTFGMPGLPRSWYQNDWLWWLVGMASLGFGARLLMQAERQDAVGSIWKPSQPGIRFHELILYTRDGCHLCDEALEILNQYRRWLPKVTPVNIDTDSKLVEQFGTCVPVVVLDEKIRFRGKINETLLRRLIEGTSPRDFHAGVRIGDR